MRFVSIVFCQGDDAVEPLRLLDERGKRSALEYLQQWELRQGPPRDAGRSQAGESDTVWDSGDGYRLTYNLRLGYIGLEREVQ